MSLALRSSRIVALAATLFVVALSNVSSVHAEQPRDWPAGPQSGGTRLMLDIIFPGTQATIEKRIPIYGQINELAFRANALYTLPFYESQADIDLRITGLTLGASVGGQYTFRSLAFSDAEPITRSYRRERDNSGNYTNEGWMYGEFRINIDLPLNDWFLFHDVNTIRVENRPDKSVDWRNGVVHDGVLFKSDLHFFFKEPSIGAFGPLMQIQSYKAGGSAVTQLNYGFVFVSRPGLALKNDLVLVNFLWNFGSALGGNDMSGIYGNHTFYGPYVFTLAYRLVFDLELDKY